MLAQKHLLIAGTTGSGKSVVINGIITTALYSIPGNVEFILIDPKRVELSEYKSLPHTLVHATEINDIIKALQYALDITNERYKRMEKAKQRKSTDGHIYIIIDELADIITTDKKRFVPLLQKLAMIGRAANMHIIAATQCPLRAIIPTEIKCCFDSKVALHTVNAQDSRNIAAFSGCELLPEYGQGYYIKPGNTTLYNIPMYSDSERQRIISYWKKEKPHFRLFK